ncbi:lipase family protein [Nocardia fluminea]|uniref:lipase family protein n=1 Tax=Nocardia fluminea TaxID=134984 RepID=UPI0033D1BD9C
MVVAVSAALVTAPIAVSVPIAEVAVGDFYSTPTPLPDVAAGAVLRTEPAHLALSAPGQAEMVPASATRIMYRSNDTHDEPTAVVATYLKPAAPWTGPGERPLVAFAGGSKGQGDQCAPSKLLAKLVDGQPPMDVMVEFDVLALYALLARGMAVVITDYHGLGTPAVHDFLNRKSQGYAVLDAARAALTLPGNGLGAGAPVMLYGYSQGGSATGAAAELQPSYAPELNVRGAYVGAPVVDVMAFVAHSDGKSHLAPAYAWLLNGIAADYPAARAELEAELNDTGKAILAEAQGKCAVLSGIAQNFPSTAQWTTSGEPLRAVIERLPVLAQAVADQHIGDQAPAVPVLVASSRNDDVPPYHTVRSSVAQWCAGGTTVELDADLQMPAIAGTAPDHVVSFFPALEASQQWMTDRLAGHPAPTNCAGLP